MQLKGLASVSDLAFGLVYLLAWTVSGLVGTSGASWLILGIELEALALVGAYVIAFSGLAVLDPQAEWKVRLAGFAIVLGLIGFVAYQGIRLGFWWPAVILAVLLGNRVSAIRGRQTSESERTALFMDALWSLGLFVLAIAPTFYFPVPDFGGAWGALPPEHAHWCALPAELVEEFFDHTVPGTWCDEPHRALAGGALYFLVSALRTIRQERKGTATATI